MLYDAIIIGSGIAGLTAGAYLCKAGCHTLICEKEGTNGGLVNSFAHEGFVFDGGLRAIENSGIVFPMVKQLGLPIEFIKSKVSIGIDREILRFESIENLKEYQDLLQSQFPQNREEIKNIIVEIKKIVGYMDVMYGVDNPLFLDMKQDRDYLLKTVLPWMPKFLYTIRKIQRTSVPIYQYLLRFTKNRSLMDMIAQHFFRQTPASFALGYFSTYLDYFYPIGGTGELIKQLTSYIAGHGGVFLNNTEICSVDSKAHLAKDKKGNEFEYKQLIWAADLKRFYQTVDEQKMSDTKRRDRFIRRKGTIMDKSGGDSVFSVYLGVDLDKKYFESICSGHLFYTPCKDGLHTSDVDIRRPEEDRKEFTEDKQKIFRWIREYLKLTTYEIAFPVMRDENLAPPGKTGMIISTLMDYALVAHIAKQGWYEEFKEASEDIIINILDRFVFPGLKEKVSEKISSTPLTIERITGNFEGAITGWAFSNRPVPAVNKLIKVSKSVLTPLLDILQAGQWTYSPSGLPISILTGKLAADRAIKQLKRAR